MLKFTDDEMVVVKSVINMISDKVQVGYRNAILNNTLPNDIKGYPDRMIMFEHTVNSYDAIAIKMLENKPEELSAEEWRILALICKMFVNDCNYAGGSLLKNSQLVSFAMTNTFMRKQMELSETPMEELPISQIPPTFQSIPTPKEGNCFIASSVYGSYDSPEVLELRKFRDGYLLDKNWGRTFVDLYYKFSPPFAEKLKNKKILSKAIRKMLDGFILLIKNKY